MKNKILVTSAMVGAVIAAPAIVDVVDEQTNTDLAGKVGLDQLENKALAFAGGTGTVEDPYLIATAAELQSITDLKAHYKLTADINLIGTNWVPLGDSIRNAFVGTFDGDGFTIKNMKISGVLQDEIGFIGYLEKNGVLKNVTFEKPKVTVAATGSVAVAVGYSNYGIVDGVHVKNAAVNTGTFNVKVGLGVGYLTKGAIKNSSFEGKVESVGSKNVIAGMAIGECSYSEAAIENVSTQGTINLGDSKAVGGLAGAVTGSTSGVMKTAKNIVTNVDIVGQGSIGGLVGNMNIVPTLENVVVYGSVQNTTTTGISQTAGLFSGTGLVSLDNPKALLKNVYVYLSNAERSDSKYVTKYGLVSSAVVDLKIEPSTSNVKNLFVQTYENMNGNLGDKGAQESLTTEEMVDVSKYAPYGMDFENYWMMSETGPVLKIMPMTPIVNDSPTIFAGGDGSIFNPYVVETAEQFESIKYHLDSNFVLGADIDLLGEEYEPIGDVKRPFTGTLDGNGFTVLNAFNSGGNFDLLHIGLFGVIDHGAIRNLNLDGIDFANNKRKSSTTLIDDDPSVGALFGLAINSNFENIQVKDSVIKSNIKVEAGVETIDVGGLGGRVITKKSKELGKGISSFDKIRIDNTSVENSTYNTGGVIGGIQAYSKIGVSEVVMNDIYANVAVKGQRYAGGIVGLAKAASIRNAVSTGSVEGDTGVGGIIGGVKSVHSGQQLDLVENVISYASIKAGPDFKATAGGIAGTLRGIELKNAYAFNKEITGHADAATKTYGSKTLEVTIQNLNVSPNISTTLSDGVGAILMEEGAMKSRESYDGLLDFNNHWTISAGNQPKLLLENQIQKGSGPSNAEEEVAYQLIEKMKSIPLEFDLDEYQSALEEFYEIEGSKYSDLVEPYAKELMRLYQVKLDVDKSVDAAKSSVFSPNARTTFNVAKNKIVVDANQINLAPYEKFVKDTYHQIRVAEFSESAVADATKKVETAEKTLLETDVDIAQIAVDLIPDGIPAKKELQDRIDAIKELAFLNENLAKAIKKVDETMLREDLVKAEDLFKKVTISADISKFTPQMVAIRNLVAANEAVESAEAEKTASKVSTAKTAIAKVSVDHSQYEGLMHRVNVVDADIAVSVAENSKLEANIQSAQTKVTALKESPERTALQERLDKLKALIEAENSLNEATKAVEKAEGSKDEADIKDAQDKVTALPDSPEKDALQDRLDKLKEDLENDKALEDAKDAVDKAEGSKDEADIKDAQDKIDALPDGKDKDELQDRLDKVKDELEGTDVDKKALEEATKAVEKAEGSKNEADIKDAQDKVTALPDSPEKDALQQRLDKLREELDATEEEKALEDAKDAVDKAEGSKDEADIKDAQDKIDALPDGKDKDDLQDRLDKVKDEAEDNALFEKLVAEVKAINKGILDGVIRVDKFDETKTKLESIRQEGTAIKNAINKNQLNTLIDVTLALMDLIEKIEAGDKSKDTIDQLPDSEIKDEYLDEIAKSDVLAAAEKAVAQAEKTIALGDIEAAEDLVSKLAPSDAKRDLDKRLDAVKEKYKEAQAILEATKLVETAEKSLRSSDVNRAENAVKKLKDGTEKAALEVRIEEIYKKIEEAAYNAALKAVEKAEELRTSSSIVYAKDKIAGLRDSERKTALEERIAALEKSIYDQAQMDRLYDQALAAVIKAENSSIIAYLSTAIKLTNKVSDADERKAGLEERIEAIKLRNLIASVDAELKRLEQRPSQTMVEKVEEMINMLPDTVDEKEGFVARLDAVKQLLDNENYAKALKAVVFAENAKIENKRATYYDALPLVDVVFDSVRKTDLEERLIAILKEVEAYERMDGDYTPGDDIVKAAESIKDPKVKKYLLNWAKAIENAEIYYGGTLSKALGKEKASVPADVLKNEKYADLINELKERTLHLEQSQKVFGRPGQSAVKKAYVAVLKFEKNRSEFNRNDAVRWVESLSKYKNSSLQIEKFMERIDRIEVVKDEKKVDAK